MSADRSSDSGAQVIPGDALSGGVGAVVPQTPAPGLGNTTLVETALGDMAARATFLAFFIIVGFVGNCVLVTTIALSHRLKGSVLNLFIISVAGVNLLDCIVNMPLVLGSTISEKWDYGTFVCRFSAFTIQLASINMLLGLGLMSFDRFMAVYFQAKYHLYLTVPRANMLIICSWVYAIAFSIPLVTNTIPVQPFPARYLCAIGNGASLVYICFKSLFGYLIPICITVGLFIIIIKVGVQEKLKESPQAQNYTSDLVDEPRIWTEINASKYVGVLSILWCIFQGPYLLLSFIEQCRNSDKLQNTSAGEILKFTYPWELDLGFTWMKLCYPVFLPLVTFFWRKEVWQKFKNRILCRKSNLINDASPRTSPVHHKQEGGHVEASQKKRELYASTNTGVPVLFATENGLHLETYGKSENNSDCEVNSSAEVKDTSRTAKKCDVYGSQEFLQLDDDTSDYDSHGEVDPFSNSNPISVRTEYDKKASQTSLAKAASRQVSTTDEKNNSALSGRDVLPVLVGDSGQDSQNTQEKKRRRRTSSNNKVESWGSDVKSGGEEENMDNHRGDITSNDSGRGSVEGNSITKRIRKRPGIDTGNGNTNRAYGQDGDQEVWMSNQASEGKKVKVKKKKKMKNGVNDNETMDIDMNNGLAGGLEVINDVKEIKRPPARLKPIDTHHSRPLPELKVGKTSQLEGGSNQDSKTGHKTLEPHVHQRTSSNQSVGHNPRSEAKKTQSGSKVDLKTLAPEGARLAVEANTGNAKTKKDRHSRTSTSDSEAALLGSNDSSDLSEMKRQANPAAHRPAEQLDSSSGMESSQPVPKPRKTKRRSTETPKAESKAHLMTSQLSSP